MTDLYSVVNIRYLRIQVLSVLCTTSLTLSDIGQVACTKNDAANWPLGYDMCYEGYHHYILRLRDSGQLCIEGIDRLRLMYALVGHIVWGMNDEARLTGSGWIGQLAPDLRVCESAAGLNLSSVDSAMQLNGNAVEADNDQKGAPKADNEPNAGGKTLRKSTTPHA
ncbi:hypothetical protein E4U32_006761 [Claviceps aff. humidiphila group G2b]|nr:hypothetical protein E4U32_006761 [Claviceps aff. humidiphila group G2b]